ncbi:MAG: cellulase family glycosylhydrolase [Solirubrobacteraceae bacterium MAG38_C4-C5]|nr:cellulase family glycosylhydrolase [Candidatus Siliceabacter maunaloa]
MGFSARDIVDNQSATRTWTQRIDRSAPSSVTLSGPLRDRDGKGVSGPSTLRVVAADRWSGVRKLQLLVDDQDVDATMAGRQVLTQGDPGTGGGMSGDLDFDPSGLASGRYEIRVVATDGVGLTRSSETIEVIVDRTKPQLTRVDGPLRQPAVNGAIHDLNIEAQDPTGDGVSSGMERIEVFVRDPAGSDSSAHTVSSAGAPSLSTTFSFDATGDGYAQGRNRVRVTARDQAANQANEVAFPVVVDREGPDLTLSGSLADQDGQTVPEGEYTLDVNASDGAAGTDDSTQRSGVTQIDVIVNDELHDTYQAPCLEGNCSLQRSVSFDTEDFPGGKQDIVVVAMDGLGNESSDTLTVTTPCCLDDSYVAGFTSPLDDISYGDVNGDSRSDVVAVSPAGTVSVALSDGRVFGAAQSWGTIAADAPLLVGDVNDDGNADVVTRIPALDPLDPDRQLVQVHLSDGQQFGPAATWGEWRADAALRLADLDGDGLQDLIGRDQASGAFRKGYSLGTTFDIADAGVSIGPELQWDTADPDGDTDGDLMSRDAATGQINVLASDSGRHSSTPTQWGSAPGNVEVLFADMDGNNADDLVIRQPDSGRLDVGASDRETFAPPVEWGNVANSGSTLALTDIGGDGKKDALTRNTVLGTITVSQSDTVTPINEADPYVPDPTLEYDDTDGLLDLPGGLQTQSTGDGVPFTKIGWGSPAALIGASQGSGANEVFVAAPEEVYDRSMWRMKQAGTNVVRVVVYWGDYMNDLPGYRAALDTAVQRFNEDQMVVYMTLTGADFDSSIDGQSTHLNPDPAKFADFVTDVANRYKDDGVRRFGIWNEPNLPSGSFLARSRCPVGPEQKPRRLTTAFLYRELYQAGYAAAKAANANARVHIGELSEQRDVGRESCSTVDPGGLDPDEWLEKVVGNEDIKTHGVAWHPYQHASPPKDKDMSVMGIGRIAQFKETIDALNDSGNLSTPEGKVPRTYLTEFGYFARPQNRNSDEREWHSERTRGI